MSGTARSRLGISSSGNMNHGVLNSAGNSSGPSMDASSLVTEANSSFSGGRQLPSSSSINDESYMHLPASPLSCSNNISGSSVMDSSSIVQPSPQKDLMPKQGNSTSTSQSMIQDVGILPAQKRPRLDLRPGDVHQQQVMQQMLQRHHNLQLQSIVQPHRLSQIQQHQIWQQSLPQFQRMQMHQTPQIPRPSPPQLLSPARPPFESGLCARRLMQYLYHQSHRPTDNSLLYWRKFVVEYFAPRAKKRWCFALHHSAGSHVFGAFPQAAMDAWQCGVCGSKSGKGYEATYEVLPRLDQIKFDHGVIDDLLYLDMPHESMRSGLMVLEYAKAVQETVHEHCRVAREGKLRITFTPDLKILCWEFCARHHEELIPRSMIVHQVNLLLHAAHKYKTSLGESGSSEVSVQDLQASCNMFATAGRQIARHVELPLLNDLGFSKRYVRCLQISEVINSMKDLISFSQLHKVGPIESLKNYSQQAAVKIQTQKMKMEQAVPSQNLPSDQNTLNKLMALHPGLSMHTGNIYPSSFFPNNSSQVAGPSNSYHHLLRSSPNPMLSPNAAGQSFQYMPIKNQQQIDLQANQHFQLQTGRQHLQEMMAVGPRQQSNVAPTMNDYVKAASGDQNGSMISTGEVSEEKKGTIASKSDEASKVPVIHNNFCPSSNIVKDEVFDCLNLGDLDQSWFGELADGVEW